jgi:hypothetical protein
MKSSCYSLIHFLSFLLIHLQLPSAELDPILDKSLKRPSLSFYNPSAWTTQKTRPFYCWEGLFTDPLRSNGRPIFARVRFRGNIYTESLPSNGSIYHNIFHILRSRSLWFVVCDAEYNSRQRDSCHLHYLRDLFPWRLIVSLSIHNRIKLIYDETSYRTHVIIHHVITMPFPQFSSFHSSRIN